MKTIRCHNDFCEYNDSIECICKLNDSERWDCCPDRSKLI